MHPLRILICDDNQDAAKSLSTLFRMEGHLVATAFEGSSALKLAESFRPQIAFLDLGLPNLNGFELCKTIRAKLGDELWAVFAVTGWHDEDVRRQARDAGFDRHFVKPVRIDRLHEAMLEAISGRKGVN